MPTSQLFVLRNANQLRMATTNDSVKAAGATLLIAPTLKSLGVTLDKRLMFDDHTTAVAKSCNYHTTAIRHACHPVIVCGPDVSMQHNQQSA